MVEEDERIHRILLRRYWWSIFCRHSGYRALKAAPGTNVASATDPRCKTHEQELCEAGHSTREILEEAVREVVERDIERVYRHGVGTDLEDLTPYLEEEDLSPEGKENLVQFLADFYEEQGRLFRESEAYKDMQKRREERKRLGGRVS
jgi:hypothetical protein